jgi:hypothetical protein
MTNKEISIEQAYRDWQQTDQSLHFGQYVHQLEVDHYKILYTNDLYERKSKENISE